MDRYCRGCLVRYDEPTELLQYTEKNRRLFVYCTGLQVKRTDPFTFQLCRGCYMNMKVACSFKKQCRNSDKLFRSYQGLRDNEENVDLSVFLKNNDDSWNFRFPGSSTPAYQRAKDDDNESTTTSIRNFMNDIMPDELPDTEARIIRQVIDEEADVFEDSLDSHWLQDDASIDSDFRLDFSFSPFSTPRPVNNDRYTPKKAIKTENDTEEPTQSVKKVLDIPKLLDQFNIPKVIDNIDMPKSLDSIDMSKNLGNLDMPMIGDDSNQDPLSANMLAIKQERNFDETMDSLDVVNDFLKYESENNNEVETESAAQCTIDRNLEEALKNTDNNEFSLDELLVSPKVPEIKSPATPFINNILFGDKLDIDENSNSSQKYKSGQCIETFENVTGDVEMDEFTNTLDIKLEELDIDELKSEMIEELDRDAKNTQEKENQSNFNITNFYCNMCRTKFKTLQGLQRHSKAHHKTGIAKPPRVLICDVCAREFNNRTNFVRHLRSHQRSPTKLQCSDCKIYFKSQSALKQHKRTHTGEEQLLKPSKKKFVCPICGSSTDKASNHTVHMMRHNKHYTHTCPECNKGFYRQAELTIHMRYHTGERPYPCPHCHMRFARKDSLSKHVKTHLDLRPFQCVYCKTRFINSNNLKNHLKKSTRCIKDRDTISKKQKEEEDSMDDESVVTEEIFGKGEDKEKSATITHSRRKLQDLLPSEDIKIEQEGVDDES